jgi:hypothetical protein
MYHQIHTQLCIRHGVQTSIGIIEHRSTSIYLEFLSHSLLNFAYCIIVSSSFDANWTLVYIQLMQRLFSNTCKLHLKLVPLGQLYFHGKFASITSSLGTISSCAPKVLTNWRCGSKVNRYGNVTLIKFDVAII